MFIRYATILGATYKIIVNSSKFVEIIDNVPGGLFVSPINNYNVLLDIKFKQNYMCSDAAEVLEHTCKWSAENNKVIFQH